jgi:hypothetical protein
MSNEREERRRDGGKREETERESQLASGNNRQLTLCPIRHASPALV